MSYKKNKKLYIISWGHNYNYNIMFYELISLATIHMANYILNAPSMDRPGPNL